MIRGLKDDGLGPVSFEGENWQISIPPGSDIEWGWAFNPEAGWKVMLRFMGRPGVSIFTAASAREIAEKIDGNCDDSIELADALRDLADLVDAQMVEWEALGRPSDHSAEIHHSQGRA